MSSGAIKKWIYFAVNGRQTCIKPVQDLRQQLIRLLGSGSRASADSIEETVDGMLKRNATDQTQNSQNTAVVVLGILKALF